MSEAKPPSPKSRCPAIHVGAAALADEAELAPVIRFLEGPSTRPVTRRFPRGTVLADGRLDLCKQGLGPSGLARVLPALERSPGRVQHVLFGTNAIGDEGARTLGRALAALPLHTLYLGCNAIREEGARALAQGLAGHPSVRALWLKRNPIGRGGLEALVDVLPRTKLRTLDLTNCELGDDGLRVVVDGIAREGVHLEHLFVGGNGLSDPGPLARWLRDPRCLLTSLFVPASRLGDAGASELLAAAGRSRLRSLDLGSNALTQAGLEAQARRARGALAWLNLGESPATLALGEENNRLGDDAVPVLGALAAALDHLGLVSTELTSRGVARLLALVRALERPPRLVFGKGIARSLKREARALAPEGAPAPDDVRFIASVYR